MKNISPKYAKGLGKNLYLKFAVDKCISWVLLMPASPLIVFIAYCMWIEGLFFKVFQGADILPRKKNIPGKIFYDI